MSPHIKAKLELLPDQPGCYLMKDKQNQIIYVGKAKVLKNRVRSYFTGTHDTKTQRLVSEIVDFEYIITETNVEALALEINLIQKNKPKYNILLKDDKSYPYLKITKEKYPALELVRKVNKHDQSYYYGPFPDVDAANQTKKLLDKLYPLRKCGKSQKKPCLYYHLHQCTCPYYFNQDPKEYNQIVNEVKSFLNGKYQSVLSDLKNKMKLAAEQYEFEKAAEYRDQISAIERLFVTQKVTDTDFKDRDVFGYSVYKGWLCLQIFHIRQGKMIKRDAKAFPSYGIPVEEVLTTIVQFYQDNQNLIPREILIPEDIDLDSVKSFIDTKVIQPKRGKKKELVELANKNAQMYLEEQYELMVRKQERTIGAVEELGEILQIETPHRIEAFDNSNLMGVDAVSAMVVFIDGKASKKDYRKYKIKTVDKADDYATMKEVLYRRYSRALKEATVLPDLIVMDGGVGQVNAAKEVLNDQLGIDIPIAGLVKNDKHQTSDLLYGQEQLEIVPLSRKSEVFFLLQRIQDEVHRFAITFHRQIHRKNSLTSQLDDISGLGEKRKKQLLRSFKSMKKIQEASISELKDCGMPQFVAENIYNKFHDDNN